MAALRRVSFAATALALVIAFGLTLSGIASTEGTLRPDGQAATLAAKARDTATISARHRECRRHRDAARGESGRV
ncbi:MAG: hypothetical protein QOD81_4594 [Solirubrobacteraceae bacterium]|jgi:pectin methylesterase-like acyl-CoA thioesterase|nr:hypothetical protein [Solirubrobacteraceae bacterium]